MGDSTAMQTHEVDVVVVGLGPGGEDVAGELATAGLKVVGVESHLVGGECPYYGCVPSKMIIRAADLLQETRRANVMAGSTTVVPNYSIVAKRIRDEATDDWDDTVAVDRFVGKGGIFVRGTGVLDGTGRVIVGDDVYVAKMGVVIATGTSPALPAVPGLADAKPWTNREVVKIDHAPDSLIVVGGGAIGLELAQAYSRFGTKVTVIEESARILLLEEPETSELVTKVLRREGIDIRDGVSASNVSRAADGTVTLSLSDGTEVSAAEILVAAGRRPNVRGIGLGTVGLDETAKPTFTVDEHMRVIGTEKLWAVGDITGRGGFTHMAVYEAGIAVDDIRGVANPRVAQTHAVSRVTFTDPEVGSVGMTEAQARHAGINVHVGLADSSTSTRGWIHGEGNDGLMKLVADADKGILVGASSVGPRGGEVLSLFNLAVHARVPVAQLRTMIYAYPTFYRGALDALAALED
ncbi:MAG: FAD-dependent pyridine nucleotide-disulfide oxidoreductase [Ilumatobacteraceae bacterium]|nr:FAD-dependent pyridine nucleotide-disulfide oxidoreductase [Ilumatobacteraceae bacterium]